MTSTVSAIDNGNNTRRASTLVTFQTAHLVAVGMVAVATALLILGGLGAAAANHLSMTCGSACGPVGDTEALRSLGVSGILSGACLLPLGLICKPRKHR